MQLTNEFRSSRPADELFALLADVERVAPCLPGATLEGLDPSGTAWKGRMRVRIGPVTASYAGTLRQLEVDPERRRAVLLASADEEHGAGDAEARMVTSVEPDGDGSLVRIDSDVQLRGRVAQFGRGAIDKIAGRMLSEFADNLEREAGAPAGAVATAGDPADATAATSQRPPAPAALDVGTLSGPLLRQLAPLAATAVAAFAYGVVLGRLREARRAARTRRR